MGGKSSNQKFDTPVSSGENDFRENHFELMGIKEEHLVPAFWLTNVLMVVTGLFFASNL